MSLTANTAGTLGTALANLIAANDIVTNINTPTPGTTTVTSTSASALAVGANGATNPVLDVDASTASVATGVKIKGAAAGGAVALSVLSSGTNESVTVDAKGTGTITIGGTSTGIISLGRGSLSAPVESSTKTSPAGTTPTLTAAQLLGGYLAFAGQTTAVTATTDTGTAIDAAIPGATTGDMFQVAYSNLNTVSGTVTFAGGVGVTLKGNTGAIAITKGGLLVFVRTGAATYDCVVLGS